MINNGRSLSNPFQFLSAAIVPTEARWYLVPVGETLSCSTIFMELLQHIMMYVKPLKLLFKKGFLTLNLTSKAQ